MTFSKEIKIDIRYIYKTYNLIHVQCEFLLNLAVFSSEVISSERNIGHLKD